MTGVNAQTVSCPGLPVCLGAITTSSCLQAASDATSGTGSWSSSNATIASVNSSGVIGGASAGTAIISYVVIYTAVVTVNPTPAAAPSYDPIVCSGGTLHLYANDAGGNTYSWAGPNSFSSTERDPSIASVTTAANGTYTLTVTSPASCSGVYTLSVTLGTTPFTVYITETAPFAISGDKVHTYCSTGGLTLLANTSPTLPGTGVSYTWTGTSGVVATTQSFSPTYTSSSTASIKPYTVTVSYNGCTATQKDTVVVPPTDCSPCDHFSVARYRAKYGFSTLGSCTDCSDIQPFHTITATTLTSANVTDNSNYYVLNTVTCLKNTLNNDNFFMNTATQLIVGLDSAVELNHCHLFSTNSCWWRGVHVVTSPTAVGHVKITGNTLIENAGGTGYTTLNSLYPAGATVAPSTYGAYYAAGMTDILNSEHVIYNKNHIGINIYQYKPSVATTGAGARMPFTIKDCIFTNKELASQGTGTTSATNYPFAWPTTAYLKEVTTSVGSVPIFRLDAYRSSTTSGQGKNGVFLQDVGDKAVATAGNSTLTATYDYNYMRIGDSTDDDSFANTNLFDTLYNEAVEVQRSNVKLYNNTFTSIWDGAIKLLGDITDCQVIGEQAHNTNNRFYNCSYGLWSAGNNTSTLYDITVKNAVFIGSNGESGSTGMLNAGFATYFVMGNGYGRYNVRDNYVKNYSAAFVMQYLTSGPAIALNGHANFTKNTIMGKAVAGGVGDMYVGISLADERTTVSGNSNGKITIDSNTITGANYGLSVKSLEHDLYFEDNTITMIRYTSAGVGIDVHESPFAKTISRNLITGYGYNCSPTVMGIQLKAIGSTGKSATVSCNKVKDLNYGFDFTGTSVLQWTNNEMNRNKIGMQIRAGGVIGTQGTVCAPTDNHWENDSYSASDCVNFPGWGTSTVHCMHTDASYATSSVVYVRTTHATYMPTVNSTTGTGAIYSFGNSSLINAETVDCSPLATPESCTGGGARGVNNTQRIRPNDGLEHMNIFPNPGSGRVTIEFTNPIEPPVHIRVINSVGRQVYESSYLYNNKQLNPDLQHLPTGTYMIQVTGSKGERKTGKIVITN